MGDGTQPVTLDEVPACRGVYVLLLSLRSPQQVMVGRLGSFLLLRGNYLYAGSAHGPGGLRGRLAHHFRPVVKPHWHIDALRTIAPLAGLWWAEAPAALEHAAAAALADISHATLPIPRFGASDCACPAHLIYLDPAHFPEELLSALPGDGWRVHLVHDHNEAAPAMDAAS